ncbi:Gldg family protein [Aestuariibacter sp. AA17]|uniref:Gldg family protein n=1 Tax=Fluctibacter corallii TaxID=2984329 RepID=A0ABT3A8M2_9ALTE|nr:Gldg family protein [Aestuariibacter sp. AA17]MCV2885027.1 Gldg family protein [Aestuariibacter sp. AA17]
MKNTFTSWLIVVFVTLLFFALVLLNNTFLNSVRLDLTENKVFTLSQGSKQIISELDEPVHLHFFYSDKASKGMTQLRNYATRVESLLQEYATQSEGMIKLNIIDPEPFSEQEDQANQYGLTAATIGTAGEAIYLGLAATNSVDDQQIIAFFDPSQERFLEYEVSKLLYQLSDPEPVHVTVLSDLPVAGGPNPMTGQFSPPWAFYSQLEQLYTVEQITGEDAGIPDNTDVLLLIHPKALSEAMLYAIDQYVLNGGKLVAFVDPHSESDPMAMMGQMGVNSSTLERLFKAWGIEFTQDKVLLDALVGLDIRTPEGGVARHYGFLGLTEQQLDREDVTTSALEIINGASFGVFNHSQPSRLTWQPLLISSQNSDLIDAQMYASMQDPDAIAREYTATNETHTLAVRVSGSADSAFSTTPEDVQYPKAHTPSSQQVNVVLVGDTDMLLDRFWVQQANFFGQTILTPFANNGDFVTNLVENLGGSNALISIRSRGAFARPFEKVDALTVKAEEKFREQEQILQMQLEETEMQLAELQDGYGEGGSLVLSAEQQQAVDAFVDKKIEIRKALRDVRHQLDKDIESLGNWLKFINIAVAPLILMLLLMMVARLFKFRSTRYQQG